MRSTIVRLIGSIMILAASFAVNVNGQVEFSMERRNIDVVEQPDCPMRMVPAATERSPNLYNLKNVGDRAVRAFVIVREYKSSGIGETHVLSKPTEAGTDSNMRIEPETNTRLYFDYVLFTDGTAWGMNSIGRATEIHHILAARAAVLDRLNELTDSYPGFKNFAERVNFGTLASFGPTEAAPADRLDDHTRNAWKTVIRYLRQNTSSPAEANAIADQLEKEIPGDLPVSK